MPLRLVTVFALLCVILPATAQAGAREDVVAGVLRCGGIADDRQWLDCVYGAAQPMRAQLGLPPAPQAQARLSTALPSAPSFSAPLPSAAPAPVRPAKSRGWMGLFGGDAKASAQASGLGNSDAAIPENVDRISARMTEYSFDRDGDFTATLSNGQVWRQLNGDTTFAHWSKPAARYAVTISRGAFGSYNFQIVGEPFGYKVHRLR